MAFGKLQDYDGTIDCTFFSKIWEQLKPKLQTGSVYAFKGKVDTYKDSVSFAVDSIEEAKELENHSAQNVNIQLEPLFRNAAEIEKIKDFLFDEKGNCSVYFHIDTGKNPFVVKVNNQLTITSDPEVLEELRKYDYVKDVWTE